MSGQVKLFDPSSPGPSTEMLAYTPTDWNLCCLCQNVSEEALKNPSKNANLTKDSRDSYRKVAENLLKFESLGLVPMDIHLARLNDGTGIEQTLVKNEAKWHKSCHSKIDNQKLSRLEKKRNKGDLPSPSPKKTRTVCDATQKKVEEHLCFFECKVPPDSEKLHQAATKNVDKKVRECATILADTKILAKLAVKDMTAQDAVYHLSCLNKFYNRARSCQRKQADNAGAEDQQDGAIFAELVSFIEESRNETDITVFKLSDLSRLYDERLVQCGVDMKVHPTRLKERLLDAVDGLRCETRGRDVFLIYEEDIGELVFGACKSKADGDYLNLMRAAQLVREEVLDMDIEFNGTFEPDCEINSVPPRMLQLVRMLLYGPNITDQIPTNDAQKKIALSLSQLLVYQTLQKSRAKKRVRHNKSRETPLPIYLSLYIHNKTRNKDLIDKLHEYGLCLSYARVIDLSTCYGQAAVQRFKSENVVCPTNLKTGITTGGMIDNIDCNLKSKLAHDTFHGTAISLAQSPTHENPGTAVEPIQFDHGFKPTGIDPLPDDYTIVPAAALTTKDPRVPHQPGIKLPETALVSMSKTQEFAWLSRVKVLHNKESLSDSDFISWAAYHASQLPVLEHPISIISLLPLFGESSHSPAMMLHGMHVVRKVTEHLNPGQTPFITADQPLYAILKQCQWEWPQDVGEDKFVVLMGGLHLEMTIMSMLGQWLDRSGWTAALVESEVTTRGRADEAVRGGNVTRARYFHQVTLAALYILQQQAYEVYCDAQRRKDETVFDYESWCDEMCHKQPQFQFWNETIQLEMDALIFIRSIREANFLLYCEALSNLIPLMFLMNHTNYARWAPIHLRDMVMLDVNHPQLYQEFLKGHFTVQKSMRAGSNIANDQAHEQENAKIKGDGGAVGLLADDKALRRWMVAGPELARMVSEFEASSGAQNHQLPDKHHDQNPASQREFQDDVRKLISMFESLGNPFLEDSGALYSLDSKDVMSPDVIISLMNARDDGKNLFQQFVDERIGQAVNKPITEVIPRNKFLGFRSLVSKRSSSQQSQIQSLKSDNRLFSEMYIATQQRQGDMTEFFSHENSCFPPALSKEGHLREGTKSDLLECLQRMCDISGGGAPNVEAKVLDGSVIVQLLCPRGCKTFSDYARDVFLPYINNQLQQCMRLDIVFDVYHENSLKRGTRERRGFGNRRIVSGSTPIPANWQGFLRVDENKTDLYHFLAEAVVASPVQEGKQVCVTYDDSVLSSPQVSDVQFISPCSHDEADTRIILHAAHCVQCSHRNVLIRTVDTDIVVLAISFFDKMQTAKTLYVAFGTSKHFRYIPIHEIADSLGPLKCRALPMFHAITGCDTTSSFAGKGKKTAWEAWQACPPVTDALLVLSDRPQVVSDICFQEVERFVVVMYSRACEKSLVNEARRELFTSGRSMDNIPPTQDALFQHVKQSVLQAGHI